MIHQTILEKALRKSVKVFTTKHVAGGCINETVKVDSDQGMFFIKTTSKSPTDLFEKEKLGMDLLNRLSPINTPQIIAVGKVNKVCFLVEEWIEKTVPISNFWEDFGIKLASQHRITSKLYGLEHNNHIGRLPQCNNQHENWSDFFIEQRLNVQLKMAINNQLIDITLIKKFESLYEEIPNLLPYEPPSLLHGDLWSGNFMINKLGKVSIFDPAVYYGHREIELAFTTMFGGFDQKFYTTYLDEYPLTQGFEKRIEIYNLYPLLVHVNLFGSTYLSGVMKTLNKFN